MRAISYSGQFRKDVRKVEKRGKSMAKLKEVMELLITKEPLSQRFKDHPLKNNWKNYRDLHIEPDWLLIYRADDLSVHFERTGTHSDIFD
jgi:mRNA interferase YafQ